VTGLRFPVLIFSVHDALLGFGFLLPPLLRSCKVGWFKGALQNAPLLKIHFTNSCYRKLIESPLFKIEKKRRFLHFAPASLFFFLYFSMFSPELYLRRQKRDNKTHESPAFRLSSPTFGLGILLPQSIENPTYSTLLSNWK